MSCAHDPGTAAPAANTRVALPTDRLTVAGVCQLYAELVGVRPCHPAMVKNAAHTGELPGRKTAHGWVFRRAAVLGWFARRWPEDAADER